MKTVNNNIFFLKKSSILGCLILLSLIFESSCSTTKSDKSQAQDIVEGVENGGKGVEANRLFRAVLDTFGSSNLQLALRDDDAQIVVSKWVKVGEGLRHRFTARVVSGPSHGGSEQVALFIRSQYQMQESQNLQNSQSSGGSELGKRGESRWVDADTVSEYQKRSEKDEAKLGKRIQQRYKELHTAAGL